MSAALCSFCEDLPGIAPRNWGGRSGKCPVCKQALWVASSGVTYRLYTAEELAALPAPARRWRWLGVGLAASVCLIVLSQFKDQAPTAVLVEAPAEPPTEVIAPAPRVASAKPPAPVFKRAGQPDSARVKPVAQAIPKKPPVKAIAKTLPAFADEPAQVKTSDVAFPSAWRWTHANTFEDLTAQLHAVPEAELDPKYRQKKKGEVAAAARQIVKDTKDDQDAFIRSLIKTRPDLQGLPFLLGKECALPAESARVLARRSLEIRGALADSVRPRSKAYERTIYAETHAASIFWTSLTERSRDGSWDQPDAVPALQQILFAENLDHRIRLVKHLKAIAGAKATEVLANRAIFDLDPEVRHWAMHELRHRPLADQRGVLLKGLRYPWAPAVQHALQVVVSLDHQGMIPDLLDLLGESDPAAPFTALAEDGKMKPMVRELVRINHHRNCMLCHPPADSNGAAVRRGELPVGPVPAYEDPLPPSSSTVYYALRGGATGVRADVTYLRQDFSVQQRVEKPDRWPEMQRFDFLVRTRQLTDQEAALRPAAPVESAHQQAIAAALQALTGKSAPASERAWREILGKNESRVSPWSKCLK